MHYDNSILYTDYIFIELISEANKPAIAHR